MMISKNFKYNTLYYIFHPVILENMNQIQFLIEMVMFEYYDKSFHVSYLKPWWKIRKQHFREMSD